MTQPGEFNLAQALNGTLGRMDHITRFSSIPVIHPESVASHSWQAAMIGLLVSYDLNSEQPHTVDAGEVVKRCIVHDISECVSGDIIRSYKHSNPAVEKACEEADYQNTYEFSREFGKVVGDHIFVKWIHAKDDSLEGDVVRLADMMCAIIYCVAEWHLGNRRLDAVLETNFQEIAWPFREHLILGKYIIQMFPTGKHTDAYKLDSSWVQTWSKRRGR